MAAPGKHPDRTTEAVPSSSVQDLRDYFASEADRYQARADNPSEPDRSRRQYRAYASAYRDAADRTMAVLLLSTQVIEVSPGLPEGAV